MPEHTRITEEIRDTNTHTFQQRRTKAGDSRDTLYRFVNTLDAAVHVDMALTDDTDDTYSYTESVDIGGESNDPDAGT